MDLNTKANRDRLIAAFPDLGDDENFEIQSPQNPIYNCIAWAMGYTDRWVTIEWSDKQSPPWYWWPNGVPRDLSPSSLIKAFEAEGFELVGEPTVDSETELVALYKNEITNQWTHASRVISCGIEHSKFGAQWDGKHSSNKLQNTGIGYESYSYGKVFAYMKRKLTHKRAKDLSGNISINKLALEQLRKIRRGSSD